MKPRRAPQRRRPADLAADRRPLDQRAPEVRDERFHPGAFFDPADVIQRKYEMLRRHRVDGLSVTEAAALFGVSRQTFYKVAHDFDVHGLVGLSPAKPKAKTGPRGGWKCTGEVLAYAARRRRQRPALGLAALTREVEERFRIRLTSEALRIALGKHDAAG
jgi:transposase